jgi:2-polyprenyl-3-methyl-5-hydroxy-6-metoxy-1,4-benzoquinol methylase
VIGVYNAEEYWNVRFKNEGEVWGKEQSLSAKLAAEVFKRYSVKTILAPGCGYGRNCLYFAKLGFSVTGIDVSTTAIEIAKKNAEECNSNIKYIIGDVLQVLPTDKKYEGIFAHNLLHLFLESDRMKLINGLKGSLKKSGILVVNVFSVNDPSFGEGVQVEENTFFESDGHCSHYFTKDELLCYFNDLTSITVREIEEMEEHGEKGLHKHKFLFGAFKK